MTKYQFEVKEEIKVCGDCLLFGRIEDEYGDMYCDCIFQRVTAFEHNIPSEVGCPLVKVEATNEQK